MNQLGQQIIQARKNKGFSQEKLAEDAKINLRTLQRIENGENTPHGDTLKRLSEALAIPMDNLVSYGYVEDYSYIKAMHYSTLIFILLPLGNIILPLILWLVKKDQIKDLTYFAKKLVNFQITLSLITYLPFAVIIFGILTHISIPFPEFIKSKSIFILAFLPLTLYLINIIYSVTVALLIKNQRQNYFPIAFRFLR